jgi:hypothetical protein
MEKFMGILTELLGGQNGQMVTQMARNFGLDESEVQKVLGQLIPAVSNGIKSNSGSGDGLSSLVNALSKGEHQRYLDQPELLANNAAVDDGNAILGHVFGTKEVSRNVAGQAAQATGVDESIIKKLLPLAATAVMGALSKQTANTGMSSSGLSAGNLSGDTSPVASLLTSFLDTDNDGDISDDLINLAKKFF